MPKRIPITTTKPNIVVIGGGTGVFSVLSGLRNYPVHLTAVISMSDDGGSTGILREEFGILPPGDVRRALVAMSHSSDRMLSDLFNYRFAEGGLKGHTFGNIMLTALERLTGSFEQAIQEASSILGVRGAVVPVTLDDVRLVARLENGFVVRGETNIDIPKHDGTLKIDKVYLEPPARISASARKAILGADLVVIGPGDLYTSLIPNLLVRGVADALQKTRGKKVYVVNLMTKWGETHGFTAEDFIRTVQKYTGKNVIDFALINTKYPSPERLHIYEKEQARFVELADEQMRPRPTPILGDFIRKNGFIRHDPMKLARVIVSLI